MMKGQMPWDGHEENINTGNRKQGIEMSSGLPKLTYQDSKVIQT